MSYTAIAALVLLVVLLLAALVAFGLGARRWNWASIAAAFLIVLTFGGYLYLATQLLHFEWQWTQARRSTLLRLYRTRDALAPATAAGQGGRLVKLPGEQSIAELRQEEARWERALARVETWRGTFWEAAEFEPPAGDATSGRLILPAAAPPAEPADDAAAEPDRGPVARKPPEAGATIYLFDSLPIAEGGRYLGGWRVQAVEGQTLTIEPLTPPDPSDREAWQDQSGIVTVYDELPADRWVAFSETSAAGGIPAEAPADAAAGAELADAVAPQPRLDIDRLEAEGLTLPESFQQELADHTLSAAAATRQVPQAEWQALRDLLESGGTEALPGEYWAEVRFKQMTDLEDFIGFVPPEVSGAEPSLSVEVDLQSAFEAEAETGAEIVMVFHRRRLIDTGTLVDGSRVPVGNEEVVIAEGLASLMRSLERDIAILEESRTRLEAATLSTTAEQAIVTAEVQALESDLAAFIRDAEAATRLADAFEAAAGRAARQLTETERAVVELGRKLDAAVREAVAEIDRIAPPPQARGGAAGPAAF